MSHIAKLHEPTQRLLSSKARKSCIPFMLEQILGLQRKSPPSPHLLLAPPNAQPALRLSSQLYTPTQKHKPARLQQLSTGTPLSGLDSTRSHREPVWHTQSLRRSTAPPLEGLEAKMVSPSSSAFSRPLSTSGCRYLRVGGGGSTAGQGAVGGGKRLNKLAPKQGRCMLFQKPFPRLSTPRQGPDLAQAAPQPASGPGAPGAEHRPFGSARGQYRQQYMRAVCAAVRAAVHAAARGGAARCGAARCSVVQCGTVRCGAVWLTSRSAS